MTMTDDELAEAVMGQSQDGPVTGEPDPVEADPNSAVGSGEQPDAGELPATLIVAGSFHWESAGAVHDQLRTWWEQRGHQPVVLITSGCPEGAERHAREFGAANSWTLATLRDEELIQLPQASAFLFIRDESAGATRVLDIIERAKIWHRVSRDETVRVTSPWADR